VLRHGPLNGWDIMQRIQLVSGDVLTVIPGSLYPALHRLKARGRVVAEWGASENNRRAKFYKLTAAGKKQLDEEWETWKRFSGAVELILRDA
jgi:PadR family transcriptional regulator